MDGHTAKQIIGLTIVGVRLEDEGKFTLRLCDDSRMEVSAKTDSFLEQTYVDTNIIPSVDDIDWIE